MRIVLEFLKDKQLYVKYSKCKFWLSSVSFLEKLVVKEGVKVDTFKFKAIKNWTRMMNLT